MNKMPENIRRIIIRIIIGYTGLFLSALLQVYCCEQLIKNAFHTNFDCNFMQLVTITFIWICFFKRSS